MGDIDDRWYRTDRATGEKVPTARNGKGLRYSARYRDPTGKQKSKSFPTVRDCRAYLAGVETDKNKGSYVDHRAGRLRLAEHAETWLASQTSNISSRRQIELRLQGRILPALGSSELRSVTPSAAQAWIRGLQGQVSDSYIRTLVGTFSSLMQAAVDDGLIAKNPFRASSVKAPSKQTKHVVPWATTRVSAIRDQLPEYYREMVTAAAGLGLRQGEVFGLAREDLDFGREVVHVRRQVKLLRGAKFYDLPKRGKTREVPLPASVAERFERHMLSAPDSAVVLPWATPTGKPAEAVLLFRTPAGAAINRQTFAPHTWATARKRAQIPGGRENGMHALRHYFASVVLAGGASVRDLADWLGHEDPGFTLRVYAHLLPDSADRMRAAVDEVLGGLATRPASPSA
jgi:integrase